MNARRSIFAVLTALCALAGALALSAAPALAVERVYVPGGSFVSEQGAGNGEFNAPTGVAVNDVTHDVYVVDEGNNRVEEFTAKGAYISQFNGSVGPPKAFSSPEGIAVDNSGVGPSQEDVYVEDAGNGVVDKFNSLGVYEGQLTGTCEKTGEAPPACPGSKLIPFGELHGVAVDPAGDLWVYQGEREKDVDEFSDTGVFIATFGTGHGAAPGIAVDSTGNVYAVRVNKAVDRFDAATGALLAEFTPQQSASAVAVDPATNDVLVDEGIPGEESDLRVALYAPDPEKPLVPGGHDNPLQRLPAEPEPALAESHGVAVDGTTGTIYATQRGANNVVAFDDVPLPELQPPAVGETAATLHGSIDPEGGEITECSFEYGTVAGEYPEKASCAQATPFSGVAPVPVSAEITGLQARTRYHFRSSVMRDARTLASAESQFFTVTKPLVEGESSPELGSTEATVSAEINAGGEPTTYYVEYGTSEPYARGPEDSLPAGVARSRSVSG